MTQFKIPEQRRGKPIKGAIERVFAEEKRGGEAESTGSSVPFDFKNLNIVAHDYIQIPGTGRVISKFEISGHNNLNWQDTHFKLHDNGLYMPIVPEFIAHFKNVLDCYKNKKPLFDANGNPISEKDLEDIYLHLTEDHIAAYASEGGTWEGAWSWLDACFEQRDDGMYILSEHKTTSDPNGDKILKPNKTEKLEACITEDCFVELEFNNQGFPTRKSSSDEYVQGENIYFYAPVDERVARFLAGSVGVVLGCGGAPSDRGSSLGVYAVADADSLARGQDENGGKGR